MCLQFLHFSVFWSVEHHFVLVSHLPCLISVQVVRLKNTMETGVNWSFKELHAVVTHCLSQGWHVRPEQAFHEPWMSSHPNKDDCHFTDVITFHRGTYHLKGVTTCSSWLMVNFPLKAAAGKDSFCPAPCGWWRDVWSCAGVAPCCEGVHSPIACAGAGSGPCRECHTGSSPAPWGSASPLYI